MLCFGVGFWSKNGVAVGGSGLLGGFGGKVTVEGFVSEIAPIGGYVLGAIDYLSS